MTSESDPLVGDEITHKPWSKRTWILISVGACVIVAVALGITLGLVLRRGGGGHPYDPYSTAFPYNVEGTRISYTSYTLETFGSRAPGMPGHDLAWEFLESRLQQLPCEITVQKFTVPVYNQTGAPTLSVKSVDINLTMIYTSDFVQAEYGGSEPASLTDVPMTRVLTTGCLDSDWATFPVGHVAVLDLDLVMGETNCSVLQKAVKAEAANASAILFRMDSLISRPVEVPLMEFPWYEGMNAGTKVPTFVLAHTAGTVLLDSSSSFTVTLSSESSIRDLETQNMFCTTLSGDEHSVVVVGAHYDSVPAGPGINDNGSGSSALMEIAYAWNNGGGWNDITNRVVFAWWGAEEMGLLGSFQYVKRASDTGKLGDIKAYINMDMLGSPNGYPQIHHPDASHPLLGLNQTVVNGSSFIAETLNSKYTDDWGRTEYIALAPNSDYYPFLAYGIPASGVASGAGELINSTQAYWWNLLENVPCDPCYHRPCDTARNVDYSLLAGLATAVAGTIQKLATMSDLSAQLHRG